MTQKFAKPMIMGAAMGLMMIWMLHDRLMSGGSLAGPAVMFVLAHLAVAAVVVGLAVFGATRFPRMARILNKLHRPSFAHVFGMIGGALIAAFATHLILHGGVV